MFLDTAVGVLQVVNEPAYTLSSADNAVRYPVEVNLDPQNRPSSVHGLLLAGSPIALFANSGGTSGVHEHSAVFVDGFLYLAVGDSVICLSLLPFQVRWKFKADDATCFGVYYDQPHNALLSHGELSITRFNRDGTVVWAASGADIFSEGFSLHSQYVEAIDFGGRLYKFKYSDGKPSA